MRRIAAIACLFAAVALLPVQAEAARFRIGRGSAIKTSRSVVIIPGMAGAGRARAAEAGKPERVPFPPSATPREDPAELRLTADQGDKKPWCRSDMVVGGFCIMN